MKSAFNLPYNQSSHYWLAIFSTSANAPLQAALSAFGMNNIPSSAGGIYIMHLSCPWDVIWKAVHDILVQHEAQRQVEVALIPGDQEPNTEWLALARKPAKSLDALADSLWLGDAMMQDQVVCYMQPVLDKRGKIFGYEAFARIEANGSLISGGEIIEAGRGLNAEYMLDRHLHVKAITSFAASDMEGSLFINFVPGFIHRAEKYLEKLTEAVRAHRLIARQIVLDFSQAARGDIAQLKSIFAYCRSHGYQLSLDDMDSATATDTLLKAVCPDFIKLDMEAVHHAEDKTRRQSLRNLINIAHASGVTVIAEGVETKAIYDILMDLDTDLFQGYLFSPPVAVPPIADTVE